MEELSKNLKSAAEICDGKVVNDKFIKIYPFTNENINGYIDNFDLKNKSLLTVGSSGDQAINAIYEGCSDITLFDINPYARYYYYLKAAAIMSLSIDDFIHFFKFTDYPSRFNYNYDAFNNDIFNYLVSSLKELDDDSYIFWHELFKKYEPSLVRESLFNDDENRLSILKIINRYLKDSSSFAKVKANIGQIKPKFVTDDIITTDKLEKYDNIWLSNIGSFLKDYEQIKNFTDKMVEHLNAEGKLMISYLYWLNGYTVYNGDNLPIYNLNKVYQLLKHYNLELRSFLGIRGLKKADEGIEDSVLLYRKK